MAASIITVSCMFVHKILFSSCILWTFYHKRTTSQVQHAEGRGIGGCCFFITASHLQPPTAVRGVGNVMWIYSTLTIVSPDDSNPIS